MYWLLWFLIPLVEWDLAALMFMSILLMGLGGIGPERYSEDEFFCRARRLLPHACGQ